MSLVPLGGSQPRGQYASHTQTLRKCPWLRGQSAQLLSTGMAGAMAFVDTVPASPLLLAPRGCCWDILVIFFPQLSQK